jgi:hypothetical protein
LALATLQMCAMPLFLCFHKHQIYDSCISWDLKVPGINVPWSDFPYMILATAFSVAFHELGHALAAARFYSNYIYST